MNNPVQQELNDYKEATIKHMKYSYEQLEETLEQVIKPEELNIYRITFDQLNTTTIALSNLAVVEQLERIADVLWKNVPQIEPK